MSNIFKVTDLLATNGPRVHDLATNPARGGAREFKGFAFPDHRTAVEVPEEFALGLVGNDGFLVVDHTGRELKAVAQAVEQAGAAPAEITMRDDQVVARLDELTKEALMTRAVAIDGDNAEAHKTKDQLIDFIRTSRAA